MTLTFISWCSFATNILFWLQIAVPILACDILDETSDYFYFFRLPASSLFCEWVLVWSVGRAAWCQSCTETSAPKFNRDLHTRGTQGNNFSRDDTTIPSGTYFGQISSLSWSCMCFRIPTCKRDVQQSSPGRSKILHLAI